MIASVLFVVVITTIGLGAASPLWIWLMTPKQRANNRDSGTMFVDLAKLRQSGDIGEVLMTHPNHEFKL